MDFWFGFVIGGVLVGFCWWAWNRYVSPKLPGLEAEVKAEVAKVENEEEALMERIRESLKQTK